MRELAVINEYFDADYFHRYNHLQRRCRGPEPDAAVYLVRWLPSFDETTDPETHPCGITAGMLFGQIVRGVPVTFFPTRRDDEIGPLEILWEDGSDTPTGWHGAFPREDMPADMNFAELFRHLRAVNPPPWTAEAPPGSPQTDGVRSIHRTFSKSTPRRQTRARASTPQR